MKWLATIVLLLIALACAYIFSRDTPKTGQTQSETAKGQKAPIASSGMKHAEDVARATSNHTAAADDRTTIAGTQKLLWRDFVESKDYAVTIAALKADKGNLEAKYLVTLVLPRCAPFLVASSKNLRDALATKPGASTRVAAFDALARPCAMLDAGTLEEVAKTRFETIKSSATGGDSRAKSAVLSMSVDVDASFLASTLAELPALFATRDPITTDNIADFYSRVPSDRSFAFPGVDGEVKGTEVSAAMRMMACAFGKDCSASSLDLLGHCARANRCEASTLQEYIQRYELTPAQFSRVLEVQRQLQNGLNTGVWPPNLWPQPARR